MTLDRALIDQIGTMAEYYPTPTPPQEPTMPTMPTILTTIDAPDFVFEPTDTVIRLRTPDGHLYDVWVGWILNRTDHDLPLDSTTRTRSVPTHHGIPHPDLTRCLTLPHADDAAAVYLNWWKLGVDAARSAACEA